MAAGAVPAPDLCRGADHQPPPENGMAGGGRKVNASHGDPVAAACSASRWMPVCPELERPPIATDGGARCFVGSPHSHCIGSA